MKRIGLWVVLLGWIPFSSVAQAASADLSIGIEAAAYGAAGTTTTYTVSIANYGPDNAAGVTVSSPVPAGLTFVSAHQVDGPPFTCTGGATVTCTAATMPFSGEGTAADFTFTYTINSNVANDSLIRNTAAISSSTPDPNLSNNSSSAPLYVETETNLSVTKSAPATVAPGTTLTYTITLTNGGPSDAQTVALTDPLPPGTTFVSNRQTSGPAFSCSNPAAGGTGTVTCSISTLAANASAVFSLVVQVPIGTPNFTAITNTASASTTTSESTEVPPTGSATTTVIVPPFTCAATATAVPARAESSTELTADLIVTCTGGSPAAAGNPLSTNTITITFNANVKSRILNSDTNASEALLLVDEPKPGSQFPCDPLVACAAYGNGNGTGYYGAGTSTPPSPANRNVYQGVVVPSFYGDSYVSSAPSQSITWSNVPIDPPGPGTRTYRFTNLRLDATSGLNPLTVTSISTAGGPPVYVGNLLVPATVLPVTIGDTPVPVATPQTSLTSGVRDAGDAVPAPGGATLPLSPVGFAPTRAATLRFASAFPAADKPRTAAFVDADTSPPPANQNIPGKNYGSESGFFNSSFGVNGSGGNLGTAGLADNGTRYMAVFSNIPAGFSVYVDLHSATTANGNIARLISTDANGAGSFTPVSGNGTTAQLTVSGGTATAVWEVLQNSTSSADQFDFGFYLSSIAGIVVPPTPITVQMRYAPFSPATSVPLFTGISPAQNLVIFLPAPQVFVSPTSLTFSGTVGGQAPPAQTVVLTSTSAPVSFSLAGGTLSYTFQPASGTTPADVTVAPVITNLTAGTYHDAINVVGNGGTATNSIPVTLSLAPAPQITSVSPSTVAAGGPAFTLTVTGLNFVSGTVVQWNGSALPTTFGSATQLTASVSSALIAKPGNASITALTPSQSLSNSVTIPITGPQLTSLNPSAVIGGGPGFTLALSGTGFQSGASVTVGTSTLTPSSLTSTAITVVIPASLIAQVGTLSVTVTNPGGIVSNSLPLTVSALHLTSISPSAVTATGPAFTLTLNGVGFLSGAAVNVGAAALQPSSLSSSQIAVTVPASVIAQPGALSVTVTNPGNLASNALTLTVTSGPAITSLSPSSATVGSPAITLTITGSGFAAGDIAKWNSQSLSTSVVSPTQLTAQIPASLLASAGAASVTVTSSDGASSNALPFTINAIPSITSLNPSSAVPGSPAFTLTVQGSNFGSGSTALWNGQPLATTVVSATQLTAQVPAALIASPGTVSVTVAAADGVASNALPFTLTLPRLTGVGVTAPSSSTSGQNQPVTVNLGSGYPVDLLGTLTLTFAPQGNLPDDPSIQFQNGSRVFTFTIPAGNSPAPVQVMVSTGTVAGTITITSTFTASGTDVTPAGIAPEIIQIAPAVPSLSQPTCTASASGFTFSVGGYSNTRDVSQANFSFQPASGASLGTTQLTIAVTPIFSSWFGGSASAGDGGEFQYTQPFTIQGSLSTIGTVTVTLVNSAGTSAPVSCQMP